MGGLKRGEMEKRPVIGAVEHTHLSVKFVILYRYNLAIVG